MIKKITTLTALSLLISLKGFGQEPKKVNPSYQQTDQKKYISKTYKLKGFKQSCCSNIVEYALKEVDGFMKSEADIKNQKITIWYDDTKCTEEEIKNAINKTSYKIIESSDGME